MIEKINMGRLVEMVRKREEEKKNACEKKKRKKEEEEPRAMVNEHSQGTSIH